MMEKRIITFKHNSPWRFLNSLRNCWQPTALRKCDAIFRRIYTPLRMCRGRDMLACIIVTVASLAIMT